MERPERDLVSHSSLFLAHSCIKPCSKDEERGGERKVKEERGGEGSPEPTQPSPYLTDKEKNENQV